MERERVWVDLVLKLALPIPKLVLAVFNLRLLVLDLS